MRALALVLLSFVSGCVVYSHPRRVYVERVVYEPAPVAVRPSEPPHVREARAALSRIDVAPCRDAGAPKGQGHAHVTYEPDGRAAKVVVDLPRGLSNDAVACIGERLATAQINPYEGRAFDVGVTWFIP